MGLRKRMAGSIALSKIDYVMVFLLLCVSGNPGVMINPSWMGVIWTSILIISSLYFKTRMMDTLMCKWLIGLLFLFVAQAVVLPKVSFLADLNFTSKLYAGFLLMSLLGWRFRWAYLRVMYWICLISLPLFVLAMMGYTFGYEVDRYQSIFVYNQVFEAGMVLNRNSGMFWEPGAFQGYIMIVPLLFLDKLGYLWRFHRRQCIVLLIALVTTQSTTGYVVLAVLLAFSIVISRMVPYKKLFLLFVIILVSIAAYTQLDFIGEKMVNELENSSELSSGDVSWTRAGAMKIDMENVRRHPLTGNGFLMDSRYKGLGDVMGGAGNGFTGALNMMGVLCIAAYFISIYKNMRAYSPARRLLMIGLIILLLNGEYFLNYPLFWSLMFVKVRAHDVEESTVARYTLFH